MPPFTPPAMSGQPAAAAPSQNLGPRPHPNVNPANQFQAQLLNRLRSLSPQDKQALMAGISPPAMAVLKKILPELSHLMGGAAPQPAGPQPGAAADVEDASEAPEVAGEAPDAEDDAEQPESPPPPDGATPLKPAGANMQPKSKLGRV